ncbi:MAG: hypothetical protein J4F38_10185 [Pseudomonadales bacterium]|nr:hypothetical protein [Pseudomonadales bacterium]
MSARFVNAPRMRRRHDLSPTAFVMRLGTSSGSRRLECGMESIDAVVRRSQAWRSVGVRFALAERAFPGCRFGLWFTLFSLEQTPTVAGA